MVFSGLSPDGRLVEIAEMRDHPWMLGTQFHPEFKSRPNAPHPLFRDFLKAVDAHRRQRMATTVIGTASVNHDETEVKQISSEEPFSSI
jgi:hypothetical protein